MQILCCPELGTRYTLVVKRQALLGALDKIIASLQSAIADLDEVDVCPRKLVAQLCYLGISHLSIWQVVRVETDWRV